MQMLLDVSANQGYTDYAEHLIEHVMQYGRKDRNQAISFLNNSASKRWWDKNAEYKKYENMEV